MKMKRTTIIEVIIFLYAILFFYTGISKLIDYSVFREQLGESPVLAPVAPLIAATLPWMEFLIVIMMIIPRWRLKGLYAALAMMTAFTIYIIIMLSFSDKLPCSCGGIISALSWPQHIIFNCAFLLLAAVGVIIQRRIKKDSQKTWNPIIHSDQTMTARV